MTAVEVADLADPIWALIDAVPHVNTFDGDFVDAGGRPVKAPADADGRVHAYAVYYPSPGWAHALLNGGENDSLDWSFQVTCAAGDRTRALWCVQQVRNAVSGMRVQVRGQGLLIWETSNPGPVRRDDAISPGRFFIPLTFQVNA